MSQTDPIADMLTVIRNGISSEKESVDVPFSRIKEEILKILRDHGFIKTYRVVAQENNKKKIRTYLAYDVDGEPVINNLKRISRPGLRVYKKAQDIPLVRGGKGIAVISASQGIFDDEQARQKNVGGEVLCYVW
ncbi:MAG: 30S ribosomal protein S8 [Candidatus Omnitrophica bacterium]|nr:30S ribosomal protein S8 [Candidatus Omnitrophota bacterium]